MKIIFHDSIFDHDDDHCEKNPFWLLWPAKSIVCSKFILIAKFCKVVFGSQ